MTKKLMKECPVLLADLIHSNNKENIMNSIKHLIKQIHQSDRHVGRKFAAGTKKGLEIYKLREKLKKALESEAYEDAAKIRDKLKGYGISDV